MQDDNDKGYFIITYMCVAISGAFYVPDLLLYLCLIVNIQ